VPLDKDEFLSSLESVFEGQASRPERATRKSAEVLAEALLDAYNRRDARALADVYHVDAIHEDVAEGSYATGAEAIVDDFCDFIALFPDAHWVLVDLIAEEPRVAIVYTVTAHLAGDLALRFGRDDELMINVVTIAYARDGRIERTTTHRHLTNLPARASRAPVLLRSGAS
jgi:ketosteroid isomerase-like protein